MTDMPRPRPPHLHRETNRHGNTVWYVRIGHGPRVRVPAPGSDGFDAAYRAAISGETPSKPTDKARAGTLAWLVERFRETAAWTDLSLATRKQREAILRQVLTTSGHEPFTAITRKHVAAGRDRRRDTPVQARHFLDTLRGLFAWAEGAGLVDANPCEGVKPPRQPTNVDGFAIWTDDDVAAYEARWPVGTRARVAFDVLRYTGLRRGDAANLGRQHIKSVTQKDKTGHEELVRAFVYRTEKTGEWVTLRLLPALERTIEAGPCGDLTFITGPAGKPLTKESFGNQFRQWCNDAGVEKSAHGLRKLAATTAANNGATAAQLRSMFAWSNDRMASHYTRSADRVRLSLEASDLIAGTSAEQSIPAPRGKVRARARKDK